MTPRSGLRGEGRAQELEAAGQVQVWGGWRTGEVVPQLSEYTVFPGSVSRSSKLTHPRGRLVGMWDPQQAGH